MEKTMKKTNRIRFWVNDEELAQIESDAQKEGLSRSAYIRKLINEAEVIPAPAIDYAYYAKECDRLCDIIDEQLKQEKMTGEIDFSVTYDALCELNELYAKLNDDLRANTPQLSKEVIKGED